MSDGGSAGGFNSPWTELANAKAEIARLEAINRGLISIAKSYEEQRNALLAEVRAAREADDGWFTLKGTNIEVDAHYRAIRAENEKRGIG